MFLERRRQAAAGFGVLQKRRSASLRASTSRRDYEGKRAGRRQPQRVGAFVGRRRGRQSQGQRSHLVQLADCKRLVRRAPFAVQKNLVYKRFREYLHSLKNIHRDVALRNVLLDCSNNCKVCTTTAGDANNLRLAFRLPTLDCADNLIVTFTQQKAAACR